MLTVPDGGYGELYERIDAGARWAGLAAIDGALLRETAAMLRDWDLQSTLLRRTLQAGARHVAAEGAVAILDGDADLAALERRIVEQADGEPRRLGRLAARRRSSALVTGLLMSSPASRRS